MFADENLRTVKKFFTFHDFASRKKKFQGWKDEKREKFSLSLWAIFVADDYVENFLFFSQHLHNFTIIFYVVGTLLRVV